MTLQEAVMAAKRVERQTGVPAEVIVAQWGVETGWGEDAPGNNCLGIKAYRGNPDRQLLNTTEWFTEKELKQFLAADAARTALQMEDEARPDGRRKYRVKDWFAIFPSFEACFAKRAELFTAPIYLKFLQAYAADRDLEKFVRGFGAKYATAPNYADVLLSIINGRRVKAAMRETIIPREQIA